MWYYGYYAKLNKSDGERLRPYEEKTEEPSKIIVNFWRKIT